MICLIRGCKAKETALESDVARLEEEVKALHADADIQDEQCRALTKANNTKVDEMSARHLAYVKWAETEIDKMDAVITKLREELNAKAILHSEMKETFYSAALSDPLSDVLNPTPIENKPACVQTDEGDLICLPHGDEPCTPASN